jgi:hypothetical protein
MPEDKVSCTLVIRTDESKDGNASLVVTFDPPPPDDVEAKTTMAGGLGYKMMETFNVYCLGKYGRPIFKTIECPQLNIVWNTEDIMSHNSTEHDDNGI